MKLNILVGSLVLGASLVSQSFGFGLLDKMMSGHGCGCASSCCDTSVVEPSCGCEMGGCSTDPSCGCEMAACDPCASAAPSCGCEMAACGPATCDSGCAKKHSCKKPLLSLLKKLHAKKSHCSSAPSCGCEMGGCSSDPSCGCEMAGCAADPSCGCEMAACDPCASAAPSCGCEMAACGPAACDSGCGCGKKKHHGLLSKLFSCHKCDKGCDACDACDAVASPCGCTSTYAPMSTPMAPAMAPAPVVDPSAYLNSKRRVIQASSTTIR